MFRSPILIAVLTNVVAACAAPRPGSGIDASIVCSRPEREANSSLAQALQGRWVTLLPKGVWVSHSWAEYFCPNGTYLRQEYRGTSVGTYELEGMDLCVTEGSHRYCRTFQPSRDGYELVTPEGRATIGEVMPAWGIAQATGCEVARGGRPED